VDLSCFTQKYRKSQLPADFALPWKLLYTDMVHHVSPVVRGTRIALYSDALFPTADIALCKRARSDEMQMPEENAYASGVAMFEYVSTPSRAAEATITEPTANTTTEGLPTKAVTHNCDKLHCCEGRAVCWSTVAVLVASIGVHRTIIFHNGMLSSVSMCWSGHVRSPSTLTERA
jgi:hypothetical protein